MKLLIILFGIVWTGWGLFDHSVHPSDVGLKDRSELLLEYDKCVEEAWNEIQSPEARSPFGNPRFPFLGDCVLQYKEAIYELKMFVDDNK